MIIEKLKKWIKEEEEEQEKKMEQIFHNSKEPTKRKLRKRINTLEGENEVLKNTIKDELYKIFMKKLAESEESKRYKEDNIKLRKQIKALNMANTIDELQQENQKYKEVIDKAINNSQYWIDYYTRLNSDERIALRLQENIDILKESGE